nr:tetratricopeptide repeat protein [uncultured Cardiobacterium sp.]
MKKTLLVLALLLIAAAAAFLTLGGGSDSGGHNSDTSSNFTVSDEEIEQLTKIPSLTQSFSNASANYDAKAAYAKGDYETAHKLWLTLVDRDDDAAFAQYSLGLLYANGYGVAQSDSTARDWWQKTTGDSEEARLLLDTLPTISDPQYTYATFHEKWQPAATAGDADAQYKLAALYLAGVGVPRDRNEALNWLEKAAAQNHAAAQYQLGRLYDSLNSSFRNPVKAHEWWEKASALGNADAQNALALKYAIGYLIDDDYPQDPCRAIALREQAAAQGHPQAQTSLAANYIDGEPACNLAADKTKARALLEQAIANGSKRTREQAKLILYALERDTQ